MRKTFTFFFIALTIVGITTSCDLERTDSIHTTMQRGKWEITLYSDRGVDRTYNFTYYEFTFASNGIVTASKTGFNVNGTWSSGLDNSREKLLISFSNSPLDELNENWEVVYESSSEVRLKHENSSGSDDLLTFEKL